MKSQFNGNRLDPQSGHQNPHPPPTRKTPGPTEARGDKKTQEGSKLKSSSTAARFKAVMGINISSEPPAIHLPWNKARVRPTEDGRAVQHVHPGNGEAGRMENKKGRKNKPMERTGKREKGGEFGIWGRDSRHSVTNNPMRNSAVEGGSNRPELGRELPGLARLDGGLVIDGSYFQTSTEASMPAPAKQNLSKALSLISLARRMHGPTRVGDEHWSNRKSRDRGGNSRKIYGSIGDISVSAAVSARGGKGRRWEGGEDSSRDSMTEQSDSETGSGSRESQSEFSLSERSSPTSSATAETEIKESDSETEWDDESQGEENSHEESGSESEDDRAEYNRKRAKVHTYASKSSKHRNSNSKSFRHSSSTAHRSKTSRNSHFYKRSGQENEENSEEEEGNGENVSPRKSSVSRRSSGHPKLNISSGVMDTSDDLSPIMEDTEEEEEKSRSQRGGRHKKEEEVEENEVWGNESAV